MYKISLIPLLFITITSFAQSFTVDNINYTVTSSAAPFTVEVSPQGAGNGVAGDFTGDLNIPATVMDNGTTYDVTSIADRAFEENSNITSIVVPSSVTSIGVRAFIRNTSVASLTLNEGLESIGELAFFNLPLSSVTLPSTVTTIGNRLFEQMNNLSTLIVENPTPVSIDASIFRNVSLPNLTLQVPDGAVAAYEAAPVWGDIGTIEVEPTLSLNDLRNENVISYTYDSLSDEVGLPEVVDYSVYDLSGSLILHGEGDKISLETLVDGIYFIATEIGNTKIIKH